MKISDREVIVMMFDMIMRILFLILHDVNAPRNPLMGSSYSGEIEAEYERIITSFRVWAEK